MNENSPAIYGWVIRFKKIKILEGATDACARRPFSFVPAGLENIGNFYPALKCGAIAKEICRSTRIDGTNNFEFHCW